MKKDIWLKPGKELNTGAIIGGIGFAIYIALSALEWRGLALFAALAFGLEAGYAFLSALDCREKDKDSVSYNIVWGTGALAILMLLPAVMTIIKGLPALDAGQGNGTENGVDGFACPRCFFT